MKFAFVLILGFISPFEVQALSCYQCTYINTYYREYNSEYNQCVSRLMDSFDTDYSCYEDIPRESMIEACPEGYKCALMEGNIRFDAKSDNSSENSCQFSALVTIRKCMKAEYTEDGCMIDDKTVAKEAKSVLSFDKNTRLTVSAEGGDICYCSTSFCDPRCGEHAYRISGMCISKWVFCASGAGLLFFILAGMAGCCCCCRNCCCCCKKKSSTGNENSTSSPSGPRSGYEYQRLHSNGPV